MPADGLLTEPEAVEFSRSTYYLSPRLKQELQSIINTMDDLAVID